MVVTVTPHSALLLSLFVSKLPALVGPTQLVRSVERRIIELNELLRRLNYTEEYHSAMNIQQIDNYGEITILFQKRGRIFREQKLLEVARTALLIPLSRETFHLH